MRRMNLKVEDLRTFATTVDGGVRKQEAAIKEMFERVANYEFNNHTDKPR